MKYVFILLIIICFSMCKQNQQIGDTIFVDLDRPERASLFDYFRSIELIPLETSHDVLIAGIRKIILYEDKYYTLDPRQSIIFVFDKTGKYLFKIDKKGSGPGEYSSINDININIFSGNLELLETYGPVHRFDLSGNYIETKLVTFSGFRAVHLLASIDVNKHVFYASFQPQKIIYFNLYEKTLLHEEFEEEWRLGSYAPKSLYQYQGDLYFFRPIHPIVYKIGKERLEAKYQFDFGKYTRDGLKAVFSEEADNIRSKFVEEMFVQFPYVITSVRHNNKYVFATLLWKEATRNANIIYDKTSGTSKFIFDFNEQVIFRPDNGGEIIVTDEYVLICSQWVDLENRIKREMLDDKQKEIFEELMQAPMELNPVLIKYWFK